MRSISLSDIIGVVSLHHWNANFFVDFFFKDSIHSLNESRIWCSMNTHDIDFIFFVFIRLKLSFIWPETEFSINCNLNKPIAIITITKRKGLSFFRNTLILPEFHTTTVLCCDDHFKRIDYIWASFDGGWCKFDISQVPKCAALNSLVSQIPYGFFLAITSH